MWQYVYPFKTMPNCSLSWLRRRKTQRTSSSFQRQCIKTSLCTLTSTRHCLLILGSFLVCNGILLCFKLISLKVCSEMFAFLCTFCLVSLAFCLMHELSCASWGSQEREADVFKGLALALANCVSIWDKLAILKEKTSAEKNLTSLAHGLASGVFSW